MLSVTSIQTTALFKVCVVRMAHDASLFHCSPVLHISVLKHHGIFTSKNRRFNTAGWARGMSHGLWKIILRRFS